MPLAFKHTITVLMPTMSKINMNMNFISGSFGSHEMFDITLCYEEVIHWRLNLFIVLTSTWETHLRRSLHTYPGVCWWLQFGVCEYESCCLTACQSWFYKSLAAQVRPEITSSTWKGGWICGESVIYSSCWRRVKAFRKAYQNKKGHPTRMHKL